MLKAFSLSLDNTSLMPTLAASLEQTGALIGMGIPEYEAKRYEGRVKDGGILLSVHSDSSDETKRAKEILEQTGAEDIASAGEASGAKDTESDRRIA